MAISYRGASNAAGQNVGSAAASTVSITPTLPSGAASGDRIFVVQVGTGVSGSTPANWTEVGGAKDLTLGSGAVAAGSGARRMSIYYRDYDGVWSMPAFTLTSTTANSHWVGAVAITPTAGSTFSAPTRTGVGGSFNAVTTSYTDTSAASFTSHSGGFLIVGSGFNDNVTSSACAVTQSGATFGAVTERCDGGNATASTNIVAGKIHTCGVTTGASATITQTQTISANSQGESVFIEQTEFIAHTATASLAVTAGLTATGSLPAAKTETLSDDFTTEDTVKWNGYASADVSVVSGQLHCDGSVDPLSSVATYDLTASHAYVQVVSAGTVCVFNVQDAGGTSGGFFFCDGVDLTYSTADGSTLNSFVSYNPTAHKWLQIRESGGTVFFEVSPDGSSWSALGSAAFPSGAVSVQFIGDGVVFDNFNTPSGTAHTASVSLGVTATASAAVTRTHNASATLAVTDSPTGAVNLAGVAATTLPVTATATGAGARTHNASASLAVTDSPTGAVTNAGVAAAALPVTATPTSVMSRGQAVDTTSAITATASADIVRSHSAAASLTVTAAAAADATTTKTITATLAVTASPTATENVAATGTASLAVTAGVTGTADKLVPADASLPATASLTGAATRAATATASLALDAQSSAASLRATDAAASLSVSVALTASVVVARTVSASLSVTAEFTATAAIPVRTDDSRVTIINPDPRMTTVTSSERAVIVGRNTRETRPDREPALIGPDPRTLRMD